jgi:hypothetical protein|tara:strand:+ start:252 stop:431 length:180 start_codon:yes stop_codon:yes gene_type:complete
MTYTSYQFYPDSPSTGAISCVKGTDSDGKNHCIPFRDGNTDYQDYLDWVAEGNTAQAAD